MRYKTRKMLKRHIELLKETIDANHAYYLDLINSIVEFINKTTEPTIKQHIPITYSTKPVIYRYNPLNIWGYIFCSINKRTALNTFIWLGIRWHFSLLKG